MPFKKDMRLIEDGKICDQLFLFKPLIIQINWILKGWTWSFNVLNHRRRSLQNFQIFGGRADPKRLNCVSSGLQHQKIFEFGIVIIAINGALI